MPTLKGSSANADNIYFAINATNGQVTVWAVASTDTVDSSTPVPTGTASGTVTGTVLNSKQTNYIVVR